MIRIFTFYDLCESLRGDSPDPAVESTGIDSSSVSVQDELANSVTDEVSERDDEEADFEAAVIQEGSRLKQQRKGEPWLQRCYLKYKKG